MLLLVLLVERMVLLHINLSAIGPFAEYPGIDFLAQLENHQM